ncbi:hypothetical protein BO83DRAFT_451888, partial [Aspergillus eucalypticola CBS 122712]
VVGKVNVQRLGNGCVSGSYRAAASEFAKSFTRAAEKGKQDWACRAFLTPHRSYGSQTEPCLVDRPTASSVPILECRCLRIRGMHKSRSRSVLRPAQDEATRAEKKNEVWKIFEDGGTPYPRPNLTILWSFIEFLRVELTLEPVCKPEVAIATVAQRAICRIRHPRQGFLQSNLGTPYAKDGRMNGADKEWSTSRVFQGVLKECVVAGWKGALPNSTVVDDPDFSLLSRIYGTYRYQMYCTCIR